MPTAAIHERVVDTQRRYLKALLVLAGLVALMVIGTLGAVLVQMNQANDSRDTNIQIAAQNQELLRLTVACNVAPENRVPPVKNPPADDCFTQQRQRTNDLLGEPQGPVNTVTILTAVCTRIYLDRPVADVDDGKKRILACVEAELERRVTR